MTGYVYAIESGNGGGAVKIGWASVPSRRLAELNIASPGKHRLLGYVKATKAQEKELHDLLRPWRIRGEWFDINARPVRAFVEMTRKPEKKARERAPCSFSHSERTPFDIVVESVGSQAKLGDLIGRKQSTVSYWARSGLIPAECAMELERATNGAVPRWVARPDLWQAPQ